jgi:hypothetical protein
MKSQLKYAFLLALCGVLPAADQTGAIDAKQAVLNIQHDGSQGRVFVNGIPVLNFSSKRVPEGGPLTDSLGTLALFARNGSNGVTVEAQPEKGQTKATTVVSAIIVTGSPSDLDHPLFKETITGSGKIEKTLVLKNVPKWAFLEVQPFTGNKDDVLTAVRALYKALSDHDTRTVEATLKPMYTDLASFMGEAVGTPADFTSQMKEMATGCTLAPLPTDLKVASAYDGRLFVVTDAGGNAPIQLASKKLNKSGHPDWTMETGEYWIHRPEGWFVIRQ